MHMSVACNLIPLGDRLDSDPTMDFLDKDAVGLNGLCSLSWCLHKYYHVLYVIARLSLCYNLVNCLAVICLPIIWVFYLLERLHYWTHGPPVHLFTLIATFIHHFSSSLLHWSIFIIHLFHYTINRFVFCETGKIDNLSAVGGKVFWLSVCRSTSVEG